MISEFLQNCFCNENQFKILIICSLLQKHTKRPDAVGTFDLLTKLELWNGKSDSIHENTSQRNGDLQTQLTQVTDELNQLKMQLASPTQSPSTNDCFKGRNNENISVEGGDLRSTTNSLSNSFASQTTEQTTLFKSLGLDSDENEDKDRQIQILSNKLIESDKEANELKKQQLALKLEIERLRDIINQRPG